MMFRHKDDVLEVLLGHPGGPFWEGKDLGAWMIPKGELQAGEEPLACALREFREETGLQPKPPFVRLGKVKQKAGKVVHAWAFRGDCDPTMLRSNTFKVQWPPRSGQWRSYPEIDQAAFFTIPQAKEKINAAQVAFLDRLEAYLISKKADK